MTFDQIPSGTSVFLDANVLIYHFTAEPTYGPACTRLIARIEQHDVAGSTSAAVVSDAAHRIMVVEAMDQFGWPIAGISRRLRRHWQQIQSLPGFRQAIDQVRNSPIHVYPVDMDLVANATSISQAFGLLSNDALEVAVMQQHGLTNLASNDADFDRVPWIARFAPV